MSQKSNRTYIASKSKQLDKNTINDVFSYHKEIYRGLNLERIDFKTIVLKYNQTEIQGKILNARLDQYFLNFLKQSYESLIQPD